MEDDVVIRIRGMKKSYTIIEPVTLGGKISLKKKIRYPIFDGIDLDVRKGDIVGLLGRNGCGKSTFLKIVSGILDADEGTVEVKGKVASILELSMGFHGDMSGRDNIILRSQLYGIPREQVMAHLDEIIEYTDLGIFIDNPVRTYSSGMRSRLAFSVMVNVDADIFLVDEALSTGDMAFASKASEHLKNLVRSGKTVLFTSHSMSTIKRTCSRAIWFSDRKIKMDGSADEVVDAYTRSINDSFEETLSLAEGGSSSAQYRLSQFYRDGNGTEKDKERERFWLEEAAKRDHPMAMADLADLLISEGRREEAMDLYQKAADNGSFEARRKYATMAGDTMGEIEELRDVMKGFTESGYPSDLFNYGNLMFRSALTLEDYRIAAEYLTRASEEGWSEADLLLGKIYRDGLGIDKDVPKAVGFLESAAEDGNVKAMTLLADMYLEGKYLQKDPEEAFRWYRMAASVGHQKSQYQVAMMLSSGIGTEKDPEEAKRWLTLYSSGAVNDSRRIAMNLLKSRNGEASVSTDLLKSMSRTNHVQSMTSLAYRYYYGSGVKRNPKATRDLLTKASVAGGSARLKLAELNLEDGTADPDEAFDLIRSAARSGDADSTYRLALMYKDGVGCEKDPKRYRRLTIMAAELGSRDAKEVVKKWNGQNNGRKKSPSTSRHEVRRPGPGSYTRSKQKE
jgi:ABC-type polysaccharide/polyol phosphate transport system ATPase subunit